MKDLQIIPWTFQYLVSGVSILCISIWIFRKNKVSPAYQSFLLYGATTAGWLLMAFFHRNAATAELSGFFFKIDIFLVVLSVGFLPLFVFCVWGARRAYYWSVLPFFLVGLYFISREPYQMVMSNYGWSYKFSNSFIKIFLGTTIFSLILFIYAFIRLSKSTSSRTSARKYKIVFMGYLIFYGLGMSISTFLLQKHPEFPPLGGIFTLGQFAFIAYAASLGPKRIISYAQWKEPIHEVAHAYISFLNQFQTDIPGTELGVSSFIFQDYIEAMGLKEVIVLKESAMALDPVKFTAKHVLETPDNIIRLIKTLHQSPKLMESLESVLRITHETISKTSWSEAVQWRKEILNHHAAFLLKNDITAGICSDAQFPEIFQFVRPGEVCLFKEVTPREAYSLLQKTAVYNLRCLCLSKLSHETIHEKYGITESEIINVGFEKRRGKFEPTDFAALTKVVSHFFTSPDGMIVLIDCLDQMKFGGGFKSMMGFLENIVMLTEKNRGILIITLPSEMFGETEIEAIEVKLKAR